MPTRASSDSDTSNIPAPIPPDLRSRAEAALTLWRTRLLDLSKRNRALNFRPARVSTVTIIDERPAEVYRQLCLDGRAMRFRPTLPSVAKKEGAEARDAASRDADPDSEPQLADTEPDRLIPADDSDSSRAPELDFTPYSPDTLDTRHTDDILQALATPEALDRSLRRLDEQARATIEEQGVNVLFLALGMLHYTDSADSDVVLRAPLVMVPVSLERKSARTGYTIEATDDDPIVNPALAEYLRREYGVTLPDLHSPDSPGEQSEQGDETDDDEASSLQRFYQSVMDVVDDRARAGQPGWSVKTDIFLGLFSFQKLVMFKDLAAHASEFAGHEMVRQLITREAPPGTVVMGLPEDVRDLELDRDFPPESTAQIVDADSCQLRAIAAISKGYPLVLEGPPGTSSMRSPNSFDARVRVSHNHAASACEARVACIRRTRIGARCSTVSSSDSASAVGKYISARSLLDSS